MEECERIVELYWSLKEQSNNKDFQSLSKKIKRSPYNALLMKKFNTIMELNDRRFCQLTFVLKKTVSYCSLSYFFLLFEKEVLIFYFTCS